MLRIKTCRSCGGKQFEHRKGWEELPPNRTVESWACRDCGALIITYDPKGKRDESLYTVEALREIFGEFIVRCGFCGAPAIIESTLGFSEESGSWGDISLVCTRCHKRHPIYEPI